MTDAEKSDLLKFCRENGIELDSDGFPKAATACGPPRSCDRCGEIAESPTNFTAYLGNGRNASGFQCVECAKLSRENLRKWADEFPA